MRFPALFVLSFSIHFLGAAGCGGPSETAETGGGGAGSGGAGSDGGGAPAVPAAVRFFVDERPQDPSNEELEADEARWGDPIRIVAEGLGAGRTVRVDVSTGAWADFVADGDGTVDLGRDAPASGTWGAPDADGPFWSAPPSDAPIFDVAVTVSDPQTGAVLAQKSIYRRPVDDGVEITKVNDGTRVGTLVRPPDTGTKRPAILAFGGSEGGTWVGEFMAHHLAQLGYVAFGVGYFGAPGLPPTLEQAPLEILKGDLDHLASQPDVDPERIAVLGGSRGGEAALLLGATYPDLVHAVVAQVPSGYVWGAPGGKDVSAWSLAGAGVPYVPSSGGQAEIFQEGDKTYVLSTPSFLASIDAAPADALDAARILAENTKGPILMLAGEDDKLWPACAMSQVAWDALVAAGHEAAHGDEMHCFPAAGHFITFPPGFSTMDSTEYFSPQYGVWFLVGGTPEGNARAERQGNNALRSFLEKSLGE